ncbi:ATP-binding protein [Microbacterium halophytorum]|uniref:ATP-binding protein n=1 Tax=Microbacterium halophytorum TaxID=2067568 RepID=UPI000CFCD35E|nr:DUF4143 domain-containing protein [Microbacterium halophytorum]
MADTYSRRVIDAELDELQPLLPAVSLQGPKGVGKTATASRRVRGIIDLSDDAAREALAADPARLTRELGPVLIDEWQRLPQVWDMVKRAVDGGAADGAFILAGSSAPRGASIHSGAGRIVPMQMRPLSLAERGLVAPSVSLATLLDGAGDTPIHGESELGLPDYVEEITASGFPGIRTRPERARERALDAYLDYVVEREFPEQGYPVRKPQTLRAWLRAYAGATSQTTAYSKILAAATEDKSSQPTRATTLSYRDALAGLHLLDPVEPWQPVGASVKNLVTAPKHHLADPALAVRLIGLNRSRVLRGEQGTVDIASGTLLGALFEDLVTLSLRTYAQAADARVAHLRTHDGGRHEVDLLVEGRDGRVVAIEVKVSPSVDKDDVKHLNWLHRQIGDRLADKLVVTTGPHAYRREDGVAVVPAALLGP